MYMYIYIYIYRYTCVFLLFIETHTWIYQQFIVSQDWSVAQLDDLRSFLLHEQKEGRYEAPDGLSLD